MGQEGGEGSRTERALWPWGMWREKAVRQALPHLPAPSSLEDVALGLLCPTTPQESPQLARVASPP